MESQYQEGIAVRESNIHRENSKSTQGLAFSLYNGKAQQWITMKHIICVFVWLFVRLFVFHLVVFVLLFLWVGGFFVCLLALVGKLNNTILWFDVCSSSSKWWHIQYYQSCSDPLVLQFFYCNFLEIDMRPKFRDIYLLVLKISYMFTTYWLISRWDYTCHSSEDQSMFRQN